MNFREKTNLEGKQIFVGKQTCACLQARACTRVTKRVTERSEPQELGMRMTERSEPQDLNVPSCTGKRQTLVVPSDFKGKTNFERKQF